MSEEANTRVYLFETTNLTMWAEDVARGRGIPAEVISAPPGVKDKCGLALRTPAARASELEAAMAEAGIEYHPATDVELREAAESS